MNAILAEREKPRAAELFQSSALAGQGWQEEFYVCVSKSGREVPVPGSGVAHVDGQGQYHRTYRCSPSGRNRLVVAKGTASDPRAVTICCTDARCRSSSI
jgi:hypothetical protein